MLVKRIRLDEVIVPARPDSINSPQTDYPLHKLPVGAKRGWSMQFDQVSKVIARLELDDGVIGLGEFYRGVSTDLIREVAHSLIDTNLRDLHLQDLPVPGGRIYDGFECAIVDAVAKAHDLPFHQLLGGKRRDSVHVAYWTGHRTTPDAARKAQEAQKLGFDCIKFKCKASDPVTDWCEAIADACGPKISVVLDPNERFDTAAFVESIARRLVDAGNVLYLEDPIARWDFDGWRHLRNKISLPLAMHVSLPYVEMGQLAQDAVRAVRAEACDYFNFNGGIFAFDRLAALADLCGIPYSHASELDLGILEASYIHKACAGALATLPSDILGRLVREHDLLAEPIHIANGQATVPAGPGLGVALDPAALEAYRINHWTIE